MRAKLERSRAGDRELVQLEARLRHATARLEEARSALRRITEDIGQSGAPLLAEGSQVITSGWSSTGPPADAAVPVAGVLASLVQGRARQLVSYLDALASELAGLAAEVAAGLGSFDAPAEREFRGLVHELPVFEFAARCQAERPRLGPLLGRGFERRAVVSRLERQVGAAFVQAVETHASLLQDWSERVLEAIRGRFELDAEGYRARIERSLGGRQLSPEAAAELQRDLAVLAMGEGEATAQATQHALGYESEGAPELGDESRSRLFAEEA